MKFKVTWLTPILLVAAVWMVYNWNGKSHDGEPAQAAAGSQTAVSEKTASLERTAVLRDAEGKQLGTVKLEETSKGLHIVVNAEGLTSGEHPFHAHVTAMCKAPDFTAAGGHFDPYGDEANGKLAAGNFGTVTADKDGKVNADFWTKRLTLAPGKINSLLDEDGTSFILHQGVSEADSKIRVACAPLTQE